MSRLTFKKWFEFYNPDEETTCACVDLHTQICEVDDSDRQHYYIVGEVIDKLADYEDKQEQGLLIELPCKVGDKAWYVHRDGIDEVEVDSFIINVNLFVNVSLYIGCDRFGKTLTPYKTLFFTRSEAEEALAKMGGKA